MSFTGYTIDILYNMFGIKLTLLFILMIMSRNRMFKNKRYIILVCYTSKILNNNIMSINTIQQILDYF